MESLINLYPTVLHLSKFPLILKLCIKFDFSITKWHSCITFFDKRDDFNLVLVNESLYFNNRDSLNF